MDVQIQLRSIMTQLQILMMEVVRIHVLKLTQQKALKLALECGNKIQVMTLIGHLNSGSTPSSNTGPSAAFDGTYYAYVETSPSNTWNGATANFNCSLC